MSNFHTAVVVNDLHIPFEDRRVVKLVLSFIKNLRPELVFVNGDLLDCYEVSRFDKDPRRGATLDEELKRGRAFLAGLRSASPKSRIIYIEGNHEHRIRRYIIKNAPSLSWVKGLRLPALLELQDLGVEYIACEADRFIDTYFRWGKLLVGHFNAYASNSGATAHKLLMQYGTSIIQGHTHTAGSSNKKLYPGNFIAAYENGCLCDLDPCYCAPKNWQHNFCVVHRERGGSYFQVQQVGIVNYQFHFGGKHWKG